MYKAAFNSNIIFMQHFAHFNVSGSYKQLYALCSKVRWDLVEFLAQFPIQC